MSMLDWDNARELLKEIAVRHYQAYKANDAKGMARAEEEALIVANTYGYPIQNPNLYLAGFWPEET